MPIAKTGKETVDMLTIEFTKLMAEVVGKSEEFGSLPCIDKWSIKDLLAVRSWWTRSVVDWIENGKIDNEFALPAPGYKWSETPRLNADIVARSISFSYEQIISDLRIGFERVINTLEELDDRELLEAGVFEWPGKWPISRWVTINTARQYVTARTAIKRALGANSDKKN